MTTTDDRYNGWANRETWALNLWLSNDEGLSEMTRERVAAAIADDYDDGDRLVPARIAGNAIEALWDEITDPGDPMQSRDLRVMIADVGSAWRVDWDEIGAAWLEGLDES